MAESEDLELKHRRAAKGSENSGRESRQKMPARESKGERHLPVYQSDRSLREPQAVSGRCNAVLRSSSGQSRWAVFKSRIFVEFKQFEFFDSTRMLAAVVNAVAVPGMGDVPISSIGCPL